MYYKLEENNDTLTLHHGNKVYGPYGAWNLTPENRMDVELPHEGWYWFETREEALDYFEIEEITEDGYKVLRHK